MSLSIERVRTGNLAPVCSSRSGRCADEAYGEDLAGYFADIGPGTHLLGWHGPALVSHLMWVDRALLSMEANRFAPHMWSWWRRESATWAPITPRS